MEKNKDVSGFTQSGQGSGHIDTQLTFPNSVCIDPSSGLAKPLLDLKRYSNFWSNIVKI